MKYPDIKINTLRVWRASGVTLITCFSLAGSADATLPSSDFPNLGSLGSLTELGHPLVEIQNTDTNGNFTRLTVVHGLVFSDPALTANQSEVLSASEALAALTPDQTNDAIQTAPLAFIVSSGQVEVVDLNGGLNLDNENITLAGGGDLVLNIKNSFSLDGSAGILGNPDNIYINYMGESTINTGSSVTVDGLVLDPFAPAILNGDWNRGFYGNLAVDPPTPAPEPGYIVLISTALASLLWARFLKRKSN